MMSVLALYKMANNSAGEERQLNSYVVAFFVWILVKYWQAAVFLFATYLFHPIFFLFPKVLSLFSFILIFFHIIQHTIQLFTVFHSAFILTVKSFTLCIHTCKNFKFPLQHVKYGLWSCNALRILLMLSKCFKDHKANIYLR